MSTTPMDEEFRSLRDYVAIARRRALIAILPFILIFAAAAAVAVILPPIYRSQATILIESQQVPYDLVQSTVTSFADERIEIIQQRVMTSSNLLAMADKYGLFRESSESQTQSAKVDAMRQSIHIQRVSADVIDPRRGRPQKATIAFTIAFENERPEVAQAVSNELVTLFLEENTRSRTERASETTAFLTEEARQVEKRMVELEDQISAYQQEYQDTLPEQLGLNQEMLRRAETALAQAEREILDLEGRRNSLQAQLSALKSIPSLRTTSADAKNPELALDELRTRYLSLSARYGDNHPDVISVKRQIDAFESQLGPAAKRRSLEGQIAETESDLASARQRYAPAHPDVARLERQLDSLQQQIRSLPEDAGEEATLASTDPSLVQLELELEAIPTRLAGLRQQRDELQNRIEELEQRILRIPQVGRGLMALKREYQNAEREYNELQAKRQDAQLAQSLEVERKAERFVLIEPPLLPEKPEKPNRSKILVLGFVFAAAGGVGVAAAAEGIDRSIRGPRALYSILREPPLAVIPYIETGADKWQRWLTIIGILIIMAGLAALALYAVHTYVKPLELLWPAILRRFGFIA